MSEYFLVGTRKFILAPGTLPSGQAYFFHNEDINTDIFDWEVRSCASQGCPAVMLLHDAPNTIFDRQWQYYLVAINPGMGLNKIASLLGDTKALTNTKDRTRNYILNENLDAPDCPRLDKLRTFSRNTHLARLEPDGGWTLVTMDGNHPPALKPGKTYPERLEDIRAEDYLYTPQSHPHLFLVCNNIQTKIGNQTSVFPFDGGVVQSWTGNTDPYTFFPLVSRFKVYLNLLNWTQLDVGEVPPNPYRRV